MEFLIVHFPESRTVLVDGTSQGKTNFVLQFATGTYDVTLGPPHDFSPLAQKILLQNTSPLAPYRIQFHRLPPSAIPFSPGTPS